jgi:hypothetical protein
MEMGYSVEKGIQRSLIKCDCSAADDIPLNANILSADIRIYQDNLVGENNLVDIHRILKDWVPENTSWISNTVASTWSSAGMAAGTDYEAVATDTSYMPFNEYVTFDITDDVKAFRSGTAENYGWVMINQVEDSIDDLAVFRTDDATKAVIIIRYYAYMGTAITIH